MKKWVKILIAAFIAFLFALAFFLLPIERWTDVLQGWDAALGIASSVGSVLLFVWGLGERRNEKGATFVKIRNGDYIQGDKKIKGGDGSLVTGQLSAEQVFLGGTHHHQHAEKSPTEKTSTDHELELAENRYREYLVNRYQYIEFKGMGLTESIPLKMPLLKLYVPLKARREIPKYEKAERNRQKKALVGGREVLDDDGIPRQFSDTEPILVILQKHGSLVVLGDPGSGKSTLLKWLTLVMATGQAQKWGLSARLPILLSLSSYAQEIEENRDCTLDDFLAKHFTGQVSKTLPIQELYQRALAAGSALILLDGLDEVSDINLRHKIVSRVQDFHALHGSTGNQFILTSRIVGYKEVRLNGDHLEEVTLVDFDDDEIETFITQWIAVLERQAQAEETLALDAAEKERSQLLDAMQRNAGVRQLAANPLLLTILCGMKRQGVTLPERRVQLYDQYVQVLLAQWNQARNIDGITPGRNINMVQTLRLLAPLALWMHQHSAGVGRVKVQALRRKLIELFTQKGETEPELAADLLLADVRDYSCLLIERGEGEYGFLHLTFEEYLTGMGIALAGQGNAEAIARQIAATIDESVWWESSLLAVAYVTLIQQLESVAGELLGWLVDHQPGSPGKAVLLAGEALVDAGRDAIPVPAREKVIRALIPVMQGKNIPIETRHRSGIALISLGWVPEDLDWFLPVTAGRFLYGDENVEKTISYDFWLAKYPVTNRQYQRFIDDGGYEHPEYWGKDGKKWLKEKKRSAPEYWRQSDLRAGLLPVIGVTWYEAEAYGNWYHQVCLREGVLTPAGRMAVPVHYSIRLPEETEWEYAARGKDGRQYPWGNPFDSALANTGENNLGSITAVTTYPDGAGPFGNYDLAGNVFEWQINRVIRGGAWRVNRRRARCAYRNPLSPDSFNSRHLGFRVVLSLSASES